jgi:hypothetical protein
MTRTAPNAFLIISPTLSLSAAAAALAAAARGGGEGKSVRVVPKNKELPSRWLVRSVSRDGDKLDILTATHHFTSLLRLNRHLCKAAATRIPLYML